LAANIPANPAPIMSILGFIIVLFFPTLLPYRCFKRHRVGL
jgi:hypothetical protein